LPSRHLKANRHLAELSQRFDIHQNQIVKWKKQLLERAQDLFDDRSGQDNEVDVKQLHAKIEELTMVNDFLSVALGRIGDPSAKK
jgi:transposase